MTDDLKLFDDIERTYMDWANHSESKYNFLNRSGRSEFAYIRNVLEAWFQQFHADYSKRNEIQREFRSDEIQQHFGSFFEIYIYTLFRNLGFLVEPSPIWNRGKGKPDFLLTDLRGQQILLECTNILDQERKTPHRSIENHLVDYLNENLFSDDYSLAISFNTSGKSNLPMSRICIKVNEWINSRTHSKSDKHSVYSAINNVKHSVYTWSEDDWHIQFLLSSRPSGSNSNIIGIAYGSWESKAIKAIRHSLKKKSKRYGNIDIPFIVALNVHGWINSQTVLNALYGDEERIIWDDYSSLLKRNYAGAWLSRSGYKMRKISSLLIFDQLNCFNMQKNEPILIKHPQPDYELNTKLPFQSAFEKTGYIDMSSYLNLVPSKMPR